VLEAAADVTVTDLSFEAAAFVVVNMRESDRAEIFATRWIEDPRQLAADCAAIPSLSWVFWSEGVPASVIGAIPKHPKVWTVYCFGTPDFGRVVLPMSRHVRRVMIPRLLRADAIRAECLSSADHTEAHGWLTMLGARKEATLHSYGKNGEDFHVFAWTRNGLDVRFR